jgi:hypothetical protein
VAAAPRGAAHGKGPKPREEHSEIAPAEPAPWRRFFARLWPAVALGQASPLLATIRQQVEGTASLLGTDAARALAELSEAGEPGGDRAPSTPPPSKTPNDLLSVPPAIGAAVESYRILIFLGLIVLTISWLMWSDSRALSRPR